MTALLEEPQAEQAVPQQPGVAVTALAALLAAAAFGWIAGGIFAGVLPRILGLLGAAYGVGVALASTRSRRPSLVQYVGAAGAVVLGALVVLPVADGISVPTLVSQALRGGGLGLPPVPFDPGWRLLLVLATALLGESAAALALSLDRPRLAPAIALPLVVGGALLQPAGSLTGTIVALLLLVGSLSVALGGDVGALEPRRLARGAGALLALGAVLAGGSQLGFLFPEATSDQVVPPMRPQLPPPTPDRELFTVTSPRPVTWRLGTLDVYRDPAWLTPPFSTKRLVPLKGTLPAGTQGPLLHQETYSATFTVGVDLGRTLPTLPGTVAVTGVDVTYDPRTQSARAVGTAPRRGTTYTVTAALPPSGAELSAATGSGQREFLSVPTAPAQVQALLDAAPASPFARLQFVRRAYFAKVVAAGAGKPADVSPARVVAMLGGSPASPYEITAGEVLLARWAGVPARIGYGWFGGQPVGEAVQVRPRNGATWLEASFTGYGWVPIVGTPTKARASLSTDQQNSDPSVQASQELALVTYVPVRLQTVRLLYVQVRFYALAALPFLLGGLVVLLAVPGLLRLLRRYRRAQVASRLGPAAEVAAAYADFRDAATDLAVGRKGLSPLEFCDAVEPDAEHRELAWLVTRTLWGDLARDVSEADAAAARELSASVSKRLRTAQLGFDRAAALVSRASLADPWTRELPVLWPARPRWFTRPSTVAVLTVLVTALSLGVPALTRKDTVATTGSPLPARIAPGTLNGLRFVPEPQAQQAFQRPSSLALDGRVFSLHQGSLVQGSLQVAGFVPEIDVRSRRVRAQVLEGLGSGRFRPTRIGQERVYRIKEKEQTLLLAFARDGRSYSLMVTRAAFAEPEQVFAALLAYARGEQPTGPVELDLPVPDPRRGSAS